MDPATWLTVLAPATGLLWLFGLIGGLLAERLKQPRLVGAVVFGLLLGPSVMGHLAPGAYRYLFVGASAEHAAVVEKQQQMHEAIEAAEASGVSDVYVVELREQFERELTELRRSVDTSETQRRATIGGVLAVPCMLVALFIAAARLAAPSHRWRFGEHALAMTAAALVSAAATAGIGLWLLNTGWLHTTVSGDLPTRTWLIGLIIGCCIPAVPIARRHDPALNNPLWRWLFEPIVLALAGSQTAMFADFQWVLVLMAIFWCGDFKSLGALVAAKLIHGRAWRPALTTAVLTAEGNAPALAVAVVMLTAGIITGPIMTALLIANVLQAAARPLLMRMIRDITAEA
ncbi:hypothetical protein HED60_11675 [Planctomycetales bacterium ZRK34]|nr:hypothetical protein HED60_11675 [Planctomycetales bacterium ZRK34]